MGAWEISPQTEASTHCFWWFSLFSGWGAPWVVKMGIRTTSKVRTGAQSHPTSSQKKVAPPPQTPRFLGSNPLTFATVEGSIAAKTPAVHVQELPHQVMEHVIDALTRPGQAVHHLWDEMVHGVVNTTPKKKTQPPMQSHCSIYICVCVCFRGNSMV